jgi:hypothetical protein
VANQVHGTDEINHSGAGTFPADAVTVLRRDTVSESQPDNIGYSGWLQRPRSRGRDSRTELRSITDQSSQFTSAAWTRILTHHGVRISMDGKGRWMDNVFIEGLWRSLKYECLYLNAFQDFKDADFI